MTENWHLYLMAALYIAAGINHFVNPKFYLRIIPPFFKNPALINQVSGAAEVMLGVALVTAWQEYAAWGVIVLLLAVFPANVYHLLLKGAGMKVPVWALWIRLPLQGVLIWWAYQYTG